MRYSILVNVFLPRLVKALQWSTVTTVIASSILKMLQLKMEKESLMETLDQEAVCDTSYKAITSRDDLEIDSSIQQDEVNEKIAQEFK